MCVVLVITYLHVVQSWEIESDRVRQKLLSLIGRIGREARSETTTGKVCWYIALSVNAKDIQQYVLFFINNSFIIKE